MTQVAQQSDFIIVGGGLAGSVIASRLALKHPSDRIIVLEAGGDEADNPITKTFPGCFAAHFSPIDWAYSTVPQQHLDGRRIYAAAGRALGGGSSINYGAWTRGPRADYDAWAELVGDARWGYDGLLKYFRRTERHVEIANNESLHHFEADVDRAKETDPHGHDGPITTTSITTSSAARRYGLREAVRQAWEQAAGVRVIADGNSGEQLGLSEAFESWHNGRRQAAPDAYKLRHHDNVTIVTNQLVRRILITDDDNGEENPSKSPSRRATGVETTDNVVYNASKEVIVCCGAYRSPQLLLLSGIGPSAELARYGIQQNAELPVGTNFHDHVGLHQYWQLSQPERGLSMGSSLWAKEEAYKLGLPYDWFSWTPGPPQDILNDMLKVDIESGATSSNARQQIWAKGITSKGRALMETLVIYAAAGAHNTGATVPSDGTCVAMLSIGMLPTSRGTIKLVSTDPAHQPAIDPNYYATEIDRVVLRHGVRQATQVAAAMKNPDGTPAFVAELPPADGLPALTVNSTDDEIDQRLRAFAASSYHPGGGAALGEVVDAECRVIGVKGLRVADASVMPAPIAAHYQAVVYAIAEQAAEIISDSHLLQRKKGDRGCWNVILLKLFGRRDRRKL